MCSPCGPMVCYKYEDCGPAKGKSSDASRAEESGGEKKDEKENQLKRTKSRELRGGIMYYSCHCIKRNGLQHDCRRTGCGGEPSCLMLPDPVCAPSQLARARGLADPAPLAAHMRAQAGGGGGPGASDSGPGSGKKFIVCELKSIAPNASADKGGSCCKCPSSKSVPPTGSGGSYVKSHACICPSRSARKPEVGNHSSSRCPCSSNSAKSDKNAMFVFDEKTINEILSSFDSKELASKNDDMVLGPGGRMRKVSKTVAKEAPCTRPGCVHWQPPPPCVWDAPCKADCFEAHPGIQPGRNPLTGGGGQPARGLRGSQQPHDIMKLLTPECCTGCSAPGGGGSGATSGSGGGGPAAGLPVLVMKLC